MKKVTILALLAAMAAFGVAVSACGGDKGSSAAAPSNDTSGASSAAPADTTATPAASSSAK